MKANLNVINMITMEYNIYCITTQKQTLICGTAIPSLNKIEYTKSFHSINREGKKYFLFRCNSAVVAIVQGRIILALLLS